jgi:predicted phage-related endonuclease
MLHELDLEARKDCFGASELGAFHGVDPYYTLLDKYLRDVEGVVNPPTKQMVYGKLFEEAIFNVACLETGKQFRPSFNKTYRHPEWPKYRLVATPDGLWPENDPDEGGVECKSLNPHQWLQYGPTVDDIPPRVELQVRGNMAVLQRPRWTVAVWCGDRLLLYTIERDLEFEAFILEHAEREFRRYFDARVRPPIDGSRNASAWLQRKWPTHKRPDLRLATDDEIEQLRRYGRLRAEQKVLAKERATLENVIKDAIKDREGLVWEGGKFTWRRTKDSTWVDWESMAIGLRTYYIKDEEARLKLTEEYTHIKPGSRRIYFASEEFTETEEAADAA